MPPLYSPELAALGGHGPPPRLFIQEKAEQEAKKDVCVRVRTRALICAEHCQDGVLLGFLEWGSLFVTLERETFHKISMPHGVKEAGIVLGPGMRWGWHHSLAPGGSWSPGNLCPRVSVIGSPA